MLEFILALIGATLLITISLAILEKHVVNVDFNPRKDFHRRIIQIIPQKTKKKEQQSIYQTKNDHLENIVENHLDPDNSSEKHIDRYITYTDDDDLLPETKSEIQQTNNESSRILKKNQIEAKRISEELDKLIEEFDMEIKKETNS